MSSSPEYRDRTEVELELPRSEYQAPIADCSPIMGSIACGSCALVRLFGDCPKIIRADVSQEGASPVLSFDDESESGPVDTLIRDEVGAGIDEASVSSLVPVMLADEDISGRAPKPYGLTEPLALHAHQPALTKGSETLEPSEVSLSELLLRFVSPEEKDVAEASVVSRLVKTSPAPPPLSQAVHDYSPASGYHQGDGGGVELTELLVHIQDPSFESACFTVLSDNASVHPPQPEAPTGLTAMLRPKDELELELERLEFDSEVPQCSTFVRDDVHDDSQLRIDTTQERVKRSDVRACDQDETMTEMNSMMMSLEMPEVHDDDGTIGRLDEGVAEVRTRYTHETVRQLLFDDGVRAFMGDRVIEQPVLLGTTKSSPELLAAAIVHTQKAKPSLVMSFALVVSLGQRALGLV